MILQFFHPTSSLDGVKRSQSKRKSIKLWLLFDILICFLRIERDRGTLDVYIAEIKKV